MSNTVRPMIEPIDDVEFDSDGDGRAAWQCRGVADNHAQEAVEQAPQDATYL